MNKASRIVDTLLETDAPEDVNINPDDIDPKSELERYYTAQDKELESGKVTAFSAAQATRFYSRTLTYKDGITPIEVRKNGNIKTWVRRPGEFQVPVKYGMYEYFYITDKNADEWSTVPLPQKEKPPKPKKTKPVINPSSLMPPQP